MKIKSDQKYLNRAAVFVCPGNVLVTIILAFLYIYIYIYIYILVHIAPRNQATSALSRGVKCRWYATDRRLVGAWSLCGRDAA